MRQEIRAILDRAQAASRREEGRPSSWTQQCVHSSNKRWREVIQQVETMGSCREAGAVEGEKISTGKQLLSAMIREEEKMWQDVVLPGGDVKTLASEVPLRQRLEKLKISSHLNKKQRGELLGLLEQFPEACAWTAADVTQTHVVYHRIPTGDHPPIHQHPYRFSPAENRVVKAEVAKMLADGIIRPSESAWASPIVLVPKPDGSVRFCVDYRRVNKVTTRDVFPLPRIDEAINQFRGSRFFTALDLKSGYWQVRMHPDDAHKTAFTTREGLFEFIVMPFGLNNAPATFQRLMNKALGPLLWRGVVVYLDDIIVHTETWEHHLELLGEVLARLQEARLKISPTKSDFAFEELLYLGHIVGNNAIRMNPKKVATVAMQPAPVDVPTLRSFLGLTSYYRRFVRGYSQIAAPLTQLLKKGQAFHWGDDQEDAFQHLKRAITAEPVLAPPREEAPYVLQTDWSQQAVGAVLSQKDEGGEERVVAYASKTLSKAERNYAAVEGECLAVLWACTLFRPYLHGRRFQLETDQKALQWLMTATNLPGKLLRWSLRLQEFDFSIQYRRGKANANADALSRLPVPLEHVADGRVLMRGPVSGRGGMGTSLKTEWARKSHEEDVPSTRRFE